jgi:oligopeptidase A
MENWTWERPSLDLLARHYQTGATIPEDLFQKMVRARTFRAANAQMRQLSLGTVDLALHVDYDEKRDGEILAYARKIQQRFTPAALPDGYAMVAGVLFRNFMGRDPDPEALMRRSGLVKK